MSGYGAAAAYGGYGAQVSPSVYGGYANGLGAYETVTFGNKKLSMK